MTARPGSPRGAWTEVADRVHVLRYPRFDVNVTLVVGDGEALVVDTLSTVAQAKELFDGVRRITPYPCRVVNTHYHFDHTFGNEVFAEQQPGGDIWAHERTAEVLRDEAAALVGDAVASYAETDPELAAALRDVTVTPPTRVMHERAALDVGGRAVELYHFGRGHTDSDVILLVPDANLLIAGDLVEEGSPPSFGGDSYPLDWPEAVAHLLPLATGPVVPGHGAVVDRGFVATQHQELAHLAWLIRDGHADGAPPEDVAAKGPYPAATCLAAVRRGYAELAGRD